MIAMCNLITSLVSVVVCIARLRKKPKNYALDVKLHLCLFVSVYIGLGSFLLNHTITAAFNLPIGSASILTAEVIGLLIQIFTLMVLVLSKTPEHYIVQVRKQKYFNIFITIIILCVIMLSLIISLNIPSNILLLPRVEAHEIYLKNYGSMRLNSILYILLIIYALRIFTYNNLLFFALLVLALVPLVHGSRNLMFALLWINFFLYLSSRDKLTYKVFFHPAMLGILFLSGMWFFLRFPGLEIGVVAIVYKFFAEAGNTAVSLAALIDFPSTSNESDSLGHLLEMLLPFSKPINKNEYFAHVINNEIIQAPYSLSANFLAEFYYYFGFLGFLVLPFYIIILGKLFESKKLFFFIWSISIVCVMRVAIRGSLIEANSSAFSYAAIIYAIIILFGPRRIKTT